MIDATTPGPWAIDNTLVGHWAIINKQTGRRKVIGPAGRMGRGKSRTNYFDRAMTLANARNAELKGLS